ncbi:hypothetical protein ZIOFF_071871 [Zingiber officinale]|uniref:Reverse transcriptase zinc-binding domain-containing protein n=1 Tax=Zingiber officinale TaxID=94328 RepID=A0A8J5ETR1_ZINOF|nr:hypothetical protein ZIOFF_071871 [Zingiber officinale]
MVDTSISRIEARNVTASSWTSNMAWVNSKVQLGPSSLNQVPMDSGQWENLPSGVIQDEAEGNDISKSFEDEDDSDYGEAVDSQKFSSFPLASNVKDPLWKTSTMCIPPRVSRIVTRSFGLQKFQFKLKRLKAHLKWWNEEIVDEIKEVALPRGISSGAENVEEAVQNGVRDCIVCKPSLDGKFTMKTAWKGIRKDQLQPGVGQQQGVLRAVWSKLILPNISIFVWRFLRKRLPVDEVLQKRGVYLASKCYCCDFVESWDHLFYHGAIALEVWRYFAQLFGVDRFLFLKIGEVHGIRMAAKKIVWNVSRYLISGMAAGIIKPGHWKSFIMVAQNLGLLVKPKTVNTISVVTWKKPKVGWFKLNTDGCSKGNPGLSSFGVIIRDHSGNVMMVWFSHVYRETNATTDHIANQAFISLVDDGLNAPLDLYTDRICYNHDIDKELPGICNLDKSGLPYIRFSSKTGLPKGYVVYGRYAGQVFFVICLVTYEADVAIGFLSVAVACWSSFKEKLIEVCWL